MLDNLELIDIPSVQMEEIKSKDALIKIIQSYSSKYTETNADYLEVDSYSSGILKQIAAFLNSNGGEIRIIKPEKQTLTEILDVISSLYPMNPYYYFVKFNNNILYIQKGLIPFFIVNGNDYIYCISENNKIYELSYTKEDADAKIKNEGGINEIISTNIINTIGKFKLPDTLYKYMSLETAIRCIRKKTIRFAEPSKWSDEREKVYYNLPIKKKVQSVNNPPLVACCLTYKEFNEAAWKIYSYGKKGLGSRCVEFSIDTNELLKQISSDLNVYEEHKNYILYNGLIKYKSNEFFGFINSSNTFLFKQYFQNFTLKKYLSLLLLKHNAFEHEQEVRFFLVPKKGQSDYPTKGEMKEVDIHLNWAKLLKGVRIDSNCTDVEIEILEEELYSKGNNGGPIIDDNKKKELKPQSYNVDANSISTPEVD